MDKHQMPTRDAGPTRFRATGLLCDIQPSTPYELVFANETDVICLLFGAIDGDAAYDGARPVDTRFEPMTIAWHPGGGKVAVHARRVAAGFAAFTYDRDFAETLLGDAGAVRPSGSLANIASPTIGNLVSYARAVLADGVHDRLTFEMIGGLAYLEAARAARALRPTRPRRSPARHDIARAIEIIEADLSDDLSHAGIARSLDVPVATLVRAFKSATGQNLHRFVLDRRIHRARCLLAEDRLSLVDIALACGFASQAHMTTMFSRRVGATPARYRSAVRNS